MNLCSGPKLLKEKDVIGWVNVPADCLQPTLRVQLHAARPGGINEPRPEGVKGTEEILEIVGDLGPARFVPLLADWRWLGIVAVPIAEISLKEKTRLTCVLSAAGAISNNLMRCAAS